MALWNHEIVMLGDDTTLVECGPMRLFIDGSRKGVRDPDACRVAAEKALAFLEEIAGHRAEMHQPAVMCSEPPQSDLAHEMWRAVRLMGDHDLTPMAAVAGTIADATADFMVSMGLTRVLVNNGGDVAVRLARGEQASVGIRPKVGTPAVSHRVVITADLKVGGICTSGLGGRSFTRGVASSASVFASRASVADAAATAVANATYIDSQSVRRGRADTIFPDTDLQNVDVTVDVGPLTATEIETALRQGLERAEALVGQRLIFGACVIVKGRLECTRFLSPLVEKLI